MSDEQPTDRTPRRYRGLWWKVPLVLGALLIFVALLAHAIWRGKEQAKVDALVAAIRAAGEPIDVSALVETDVPDAQNIVVLIRQAIAAKVTDADREQRVDDLSREDDYAFTPPLNKAEVAILREQSDADDAALSILFKIRERHGVYWNDTPTSPMLNWMLPDLGPIRRLAHLLGDDARLAKSEGRDEDALRDLSNLHPIAEAVGQKWSLVGYLVGAGIQALAADRAIEFAPDLDVSDGPTREEARQLILAFMDDTSPERLERFGLIGERVGSHDTFANLISGNMSLTSVTGSGMPTRGGRGAAVLGYFLTPMFYRADALVLQHNTIALKHVNAKDLASFRTQAAEMTAIETRASASSLDMMAKIFMPSLDRAVAIRYRVITDRHLAATALAIRLYQLDHSGQRPATLDLLVPQYLPTVPMDAIDGKPLRYDPKRAIVWSVGDNGIDDGGNATQKRAGHTERWTMTDAVVFLDRRPRPTAAPSASTAPSTSPTP